MVRYLIYFSYIGTKYCGVQSQYHTDLTTVHGVLRNAFQSFVPQEEVALVCASRTDSGVHAMRAAAHVDLHMLPRWRWYPKKCRRKFRHLAQQLDTTTLITKAVNRRLMTAKEDIRVLEAREVPETFNCRENAKWKKYLYRLAVTNKVVEQRRRFGLETFPVFEFDRCTPLLNFPIDIDKLHEAARLFVGTHDFATFAKPKHKEENTVRTIDSITINPGIPFLMNHQQSGNAYDFWDVEFKGKSFLWNQIRRITGAMVAVAGGRLSNDDIQYMLDNPNYLNWNNRASCLSGSGLYLKEIHYDEEDLKMPDYIRDENDTLQSVAIEDSLS